MSTTSSDNLSTEDLIKEGYEKHDVDVRFIIAFAIVCISTLVACIIGLDTLFIYTKDTMIRNANNVEPKALNALRADSHQKLAEYSIIDKEKGVYRIHIDRAMKIIAGHVDTSPKP